jgi:hypothetical protein
MKVVTYEATVEDGQVRLPAAVHLPEHAKVYVVVPEGEEAPRFHLRSPRLARPEQLSAFAKEVVEDERDAGL